MGHPLSAPAHLEPGRGCTAAASAKIPGVYVVRSRQGGRQPGDRRQRPIGQSEHYSAFGDAGGAGEFGAGAGFARRSHSMVEGADSRPARCLSSWPA